MSSLSLHMKSLGRLLHHHRRTLCSLSSPSHANPSRTTTSTRTTPLQLQPLHRQPFSRYSANLIMTGRETFRISDYDCVGFDLDNTVLRYKIAAMVRLEYDILARYLVEQKGYAPDRLLRPLDEQLDFLQRGLIIDLRRGNVLKVAADGFIRRAAHGTRFLSDDEIVAVYSAERRWELVEAYRADLLHTWDGPAAESMRTLLDFFDMPLSVLFGRCVDTADDGKEVDLATVEYNIWPDILEGVFQVYSREHFESGDSPYFEALKARPADYIHPTSPAFIDYLRRLKASNTTTFLLTGSHIDFANLTASQALGSDWRTLFDVVVCFAKKPGFFGPQQRAFVRLSGAHETDEVRAADMRLGEVYSQGNWPELLQVLRTKRGGEEATTEQPRILYVGDNLVQDVYAPRALSGCDTVAIVEELLAEGGSVDGGAVHEAADLLVSKGWGSYFGRRNDPTLWSDVLQRNAKLCVANVADLAEQPLDYEYAAFSADGGSCSKGFWPAEPRDYSEN